MKIERPVYLNELIRSKGNGTKSDAMKKIADSWEE